MTCSTRGLTIRCIFIASYPAVPAFFFFVCRKKKAVPLGTRLVLRVAGGSLGLRLINDVTAVLILSSSFFLYDKT